MPPSAQSPMLPKSEAMGLQASKPARQLESDAYAASSSSATSSPIGAGGRDGWTRFYIGHYSRPVAFWFLNIVSSFASFASFGAIDIWQYLLLGFFVKKSWWYSSASKNSVNLSKVVAVGFFQRPFFSVSSIAVFAVTSCSSLS